jgi:hypothetical protein
MQKEVSSRRHLFKATSLIGAALVAKAIGLLDTPQAEAKVKLKDQDHDHDHDDHPPSNPSPNYHNPHHSHCFLKGTSLLTPNGRHVKVEALRVGDWLHTPSGPKQIKHIHTEEDLEPIKIARGALHPNIPSSDLYISQHHAVLIDGALIEAGLLVNGETITRPPREYFDSDSDSSLRFYHIQFDTHDVIYAEGLKCETLRGEGGTEYAPRYSYRKRNEIKSHLRSALTPIVDFRNKADLIRDQLAV